MSLLLQPERPADDAPATRARRFASSESTSGWPRCRWPSPPRRPSPGSSRRSSSQARMSAPAAASSAGRRTPTEAYSTTSASGCSAAWNGRSWRRAPLSSDDFLDFPAVVETLHEAGKSSEETPIRRLGQIMSAACSRPDQLLQTSAERSAGAGLAAIRGPEAARKPASPVVTRARGRQRCRSGSSARHSLRRVAPLPVAQRAAFRRAETGGHRRGRAPPCQPSWRPAYWRPAIRPG